MQGKDPNKPPTLKQIKVVKALSANVGSITEAVRQAGYSENMASNPSRIVRSEGVQKLIALGDVKGITDDYCLSVVKRAMDGDKLDIAINAVKLWWQTKYPRQSQEAETINNTQINISGVEQGAYLYFQEKTGLTKEEIDTRLGITSNKPIK